MNININTEFVWLAFFDGDNKFFSQQILFGKYPKIFQKNCLHAKFDFFVHNVVLDTQKLDFSVSLNSCSKKMRNVSFYMAFLGKPWSMPDCIQTQILRMIIFEFFSKILKFDTFLVTFVYGNSKTIQVVSNALKKQDCRTFSDFNL